MGLPYMGHPGRYGRVGLKSLFPCSTTIPPGRPPDGPSHWSRVQPPGATTCWGGREAAVTPPNAPTSRCSCPPPRCGRCPRTQTRFRMSTDMRQDDKSFAAGEGSVQRWISASTASHRGAERPAIAGQYPRTLEHTPHHGDPGPAASISLPA